MTTQTLALPEFTYAHIGTKSTILHAFRDSGGKMHSVCEMTEPRKRGPGFCMKPSLDEAGYMPCMECKSRIHHARTGSRPLKDVPATDTKYDGLAADRVVRTKGYTARPAEVDPPTKSSRDILEDVMVEPAGDDGAICDECGCLESDGCACKSTTPAPSACPVTAPGAAEPRDEATAEPDAAPAPEADPDPMPVTEAELDGVRFTRVPRDALNALLGELNEWRRNAVMLQPAERAVVSRVLRAVLRSNLAPLNDGEWDCLALAYAGIVANRPEVA